MGTYLNPALSIKQLGRPLPIGSYQRLIRKMQPGERLFILSKRGDSWQCCHAKSDQLFQIIHLDISQTIDGYVDTYWAMDDETFRQKFPWAVGNYHAQEGVQPIEIGVQPIKIFEPDGEKSL
jgi:hypothetical protein